MQLSGRHPAQVSSSKTGGPELLFYDGTCGVCHGAVKFILHRDPLGLFRFAPLHGKEFKRVMADRPEVDLPDSIVILTDRGDLLVRSEAMLHVLGRLSGMWRLVATAGRLIPRKFLDLLYDFFAANRRRFAAPPSAACPIVPTNVRSRFME